MPKKAAKVNPPVDINDQEATKQSGKQPENGSKAEETTLSAREAAQELGTDPRTFRKFLRDRGMGVGQGKRYALPSRSLAALKKQFVAWNKAEADAKAKRAQEQAEAAAKVADLVEEDDDEVAIEVIEDTDLEDALAELDDEE